MSEARKKELMDKYHLPEDVANKLSVYSAPRGIYNNKKTETPPITHVKETLSVENQETQLVATSEEQPSILNLYNIKNDEEPIIKKKLLSKEEEEIAVVEKELEEVLKEI